MLPAEYQEVRLPLLREAADLDAWQAERDAELNGHRAPRPQLGVHPPLKPLEGRRRTVGADDTPHRGAEQRQRSERDHPYHGDTSECPFGEVQPCSHGGSSGLGLVGGDDNVAKPHGSGLVDAAGSRTPREGFVLAPGYPRQAPTARGGLRGPPGGVCRGVSGM